MTEFEQLYLIIPIVGIFIGGILYVIIDRWLKRVERRDTGRRT